MTATWTLTNIVCTPTDGPITITVTIEDASNTKIITADNTQPIINVIKPEDGLYFFDTKIFRMSNPVIIGGINIEWNAEDTSGIQKTEIYR